MQRFNFSLLPPCTCRQPLQEARQATQEQMLYLSSNLTCCCAGLFCSTSTKDFIHLPMSVAYWSPSRTIGTF